MFATSDPLARIIRDPHNRASDALFIQFFMNNAG